MDVASRDVTEERKHCTQRLRARSHRGKANMKAKKIQEPAKVVKEKNSNIKEKFHFRLFVSLYGPLAALLVILSLPFHSCFLKSNTTRLSFHRTVCFQCHCKGQGHLKVAYFWRLRFGASSIYRHRNFTSHRFVYYLWAKFDAKVLGYRVWFLDVFLWSLFQQFYNLGFSWTRTRRVSVW